MVNCVVRFRKTHPKIGTRKLKHLLAQAGYNCGRDFLFDLLKQRGLLIARKRSHTRTTNSNHPYKRYKNLTSTLHITAPNQLWVADITYMRTTSSYWYLSLITDAYSRKIVGYCVSPTLSHHGPLLALKRAIKKRSLNDRQPLIHHSDRGCQYCCHAYTAELAKHNITISMTETSSPYDNALAERMNGILKHEYGLNQIFPDHKTLIEAVNKAVDSYNNKRPHSALDMKTPHQIHGI